MHPDDYRGVQVWEPGLVRLHHTLSSILPVRHAGVVSVMYQPRSGPWFVVAGLTERACGRALLPQFYPAGSHAGDCCRQSGPCGLCAHKHMPIIYVQLGQVVLAWGQNLCRNECADT